MFWEYRIFADFKTRVHMATARLSEKHEEKAFSSSASPTSKAVWKKATPKLKYRYKNQATVFENHSKCRICNFSILAFPPIFVLLKVTCLVTLFDFCPLKKFNITYGKIGILRHWSHNDQHWKTTLEKLGFQPRFFQMMLRFLASRLIILMLSEM